MNRHRFWLGLILLGYLVITIAYGVINPLFEAPDEHWHFFTAEEIARTGRLPAVTDPPDEWLGQEAAQPPLYYLLGSVLVRPFDTSEAREEVWLNPFAWIGNADALANTNRMVHTPAEAWPWEGYALSAHLLRLFSTLLGLGTVLAVYGSGRLIWPDDSVLPLLAAGLVAFLPQFNFIHAAITNDALMTFLASAALFQLIWFWQRLEPATPRGQVIGRLLLLGVTVGLAALSKTAGILLILFSGGFLFVLALRDIRYRLIAQAAAFVAVPAVLVAGWLWLRNWNLYDDITAANQFIAIAGGDRGYSLWQVLGESSGLLLSFIGVFGWFNLQPPDWIYWVWGGLVAVGVLGALSCVWISRRHPAPAPVRTTMSDWLQSDWILPLLLSGWVLAVYAGLATFMMQTEAAQGRLLFPAILPLALALAWGLVGSGRCALNGVQAAVRRVAALPVLVALLTTLYCLLFVIRPAYTLPQTVLALPASAAPVLPELVDRGLGLELLGAEIEGRTAEPGDVVWMTLYWRADETPTEPPEFVLELFGREMNRVANLHTYHGRGQYPATLWPPGAIIADRFAVQIDPETNAPVLGRVFARVEDGNPGIQVGELKIVPPRRPAAPEQTLAEIGDNIQVAQVTISPEQVVAGEPIEVAVDWYVAVGRPGATYTTLLHLGQPDQPPLATGDAPPVGGDYPTRVWGNGETISDNYSLIIPSGLPSGRYPVWLGLYDSATGERLPVTVDGEVQSNGVYLAGWVEVNGCDPQDPDCG